MKDYARLARLTVCVITTALTSTFTAGTARAQAAPAPAAVPPTPMLPPPAAMAAPPPAAPVPDGTPPAAVATEAAPPTASEAMPATRPDVLPPIDVGAWLRAGGIFQGTDPSKLNDWHMDHAYVELHAGGKITKKVGVTLNLNADMANYGVAGGNAPNVVQIEDAILSFDFVDEFHLWAGHLLVPVDRSNASGPFFMIPWNFPGFFSSPQFVGAPKEGPYGRSNGAVAWGDIQGGKFNYMVGVFDNGDVTSSPLYSGRLRLALLDPEPGFWGNASYFGDKDILSFDLGGQAQQHGTIDGDKTYADVNVDGLFEKKLAGGSWATAEAAYYHFNQDSGAVSDSLYALLAYATPKIGVGNIQPMVRFQWEKVKDNPLSNPWNIDAAVSYLIKGPALRVIATYSHTKLLTMDATTMALANATANSIQLGAQAIFF
jgi:hypothetical protein